MNFPSQDNPSEAQRESQSHHTPLGRLAATPNAGAADWIVAALRDFDYTVGSLVPPVFDAYARVFHPAARDTGENAIVVRWAEVADANGRVMHPAAEWGSITGSWAYQYHSTQPGVWDRAPATGHLPRELAQRLSAILSAHTAEPTHAYFGIWEGWGTGGKIISLFSEDTPEQLRQERHRQAQDLYDAEVTAWQGLLGAAAHFDVPHRRMHLLHGPLAAIDDFYGDPSKLCPRNPPSLWWPADGRWCVATDIDLMTTYVGSSRDTIETLLANERLEALPVTDTQSITWEADKINPLPPPP